MADLETRVRERANSFAADVAALVRASIAEEVFRLVGGSRAGKGRVGRPKGSKSAAKPGPKPGRRGRRGGGGDTAKDQKVLEVVRAAKDGISARDLSAAVGLKGNQLSYRLDKLRKAGQVRTRGVTSKMRYFAA